MKKAERRNIFHLSISFLLYHHSFLLLFMIYTFSGWYFVFSNKEQIIKNVFHMSLRYFILLLFDGKYLTYNQTSETWWCITKYSMAKLLSTCCDWPNTHTHTQSYVRVGASSGIWSGYVLVADIHNFIPIVVHRRYFLPFNLIFLLSFLFSYFCSFLVFG